MKKKNVTKNKKVVKKKNEVMVVASRSPVRKSQNKNNFKNFTLEIKAIISSARKLTVKSVNSLQVVSNFLVGQRIVEFEQGGKDRAAYGKEILRKLSDEITKDFGKGYSKSNLEYMRKFYLVYSDLIFKKTQTASGELLNSITQTASGECKELAKTEGSLQISQALSAKLPLSWSHYVFLMSVNNIEERAFYEIEAASENWAIKELKRQFDSSLYERLTLSRDKKAVKKLSEKGLIVTKPEDIIKDPCVLEFLGLDEKTKYSESELETAIIDKLEHFLLELGKGYLFEARQKRFTFDEDHFFVDLVFYNRLLKAYVLIDLKIGELKHQDLGQMQMYVNYFDRYVKLKDEKPTIGIILCKKKKESLVEITLPKGANIHASSYQLYLPTKEALIQQIKEAIDDEYIKNAKKSIGER